MNTALKFLPVVALGIIAGASTRANATPLPVNAPTLTVDTISAPLGGTLLATAITPISNTSYSGIARSAVYDTPTGLDFYYQFTNDASSVNGVERFTGYDYSSVGSATILNVFQTGTAFGIFVAGTETADYADRTTLGVVGFSFIPNGNSKIDPGTTSFTEIVATTAHNFKAGNFGLLDGIGANAAGFAPASPVPEPSRSAMVLAGLAILGAVLSRRSPSW